MKKIVIALTALALLVVGTHAIQAKTPHKARRIEMSVTEAGFTPSKLTVKRGESVVLVVTRKTDKTCATKVIVHVSKKKTVTKDLPLNKTVEIPVTFKNAGELTYACGMGHVSGVILVQ